MKPSLQLRLSQHLALTPQLQQSIRLLQLSTLELHQEVEQMLEQNPFLETEEEAPTSDFMPERSPPVAERAAEQTAEREDADGGEADAGVDSTDFGAAGRDDWENGTEGEDFDGIRELPGAPAAGGADDGDPIERSGVAPTLQDHLRGQLTGMRLSDEDNAAVLVLIESLNEDGYLADPLEEIAERLAAGAEPQAVQDLLDRLSCALKWLQSMEPTGVGARDLGECLTLQLRTRARSQAQMIAILICKQHLDLLARRDMRKLVAATGADEGLLRHAQALIMGCEPKPGRPFSPAESNIIVPDVIVQKAGRGWKAVLNPDVMPKLRVNDVYARAIRGTRGGASASGAGMPARLQEARWFLKNIQQRFETIARVSNATIERQKGFFTHGAIAMKPLVLREIADELGLHESTISRVTTAKYMATPFGTYELKYFFGSSLATEAGGNASSTAVRVLIQQLIGAEDAAQPLSDNQLAQMLAEQGIQVARRTVAKYREGLKIAPANLRKTM